MEVHIKKTKEIERKRVQMGRVISRLPHQHLHSTQRWRSMAWCDACL